jgi:hypothetical protein
MGMLMFRYRITDRFYREMMSGWSTRKEPTLTRVVEEPLG